MLFLIWWTEEAEKLKDLVRIKEEELSSTERNLTFFSMERRTVRIYAFLDIIYYNCIYF